MSDSNDDLEGRQLVLLLVFFCSVGGGLYLIGWLTRPSLFSEHPLTCAAIAGAACYPARFLVERHAWWLRLAPYTARVVVDQDVKRALRRIRRQIQKDRIRIAIGLLAILLALILLPLEIMGEGHPLKVFTNRMDWSNPWTDYLIIGAVCAATAGLAALPFFATVRHRHDTRRTLGRARTVTATVTLTEVDAKPGSPRPAYLTFESNGQLWRLVVESFDPAALQPGTRVLLTGDLCQRGWVALLTSPPLLPEAKLDDRGPASTRP